MLELCIVRHGETAWNRELRFQGQSNVPLNAIGLAQAERVADALGDESFDRILSSDLDRAVQTAMPLAQRLGTVPRPHRGWREQSFGVFEGLTAPVIRQRYATLWTQWARHDAEFAITGGESPRHVEQRILGVLNALDDQYRGERLAIFTHGGILDVLWRLAQGEPMSGPRRCDIPNGGINRLRWQRGTLSIEQWAEADHLADLPEQPTTVPASVREAHA